MESTTTTTNKSSQSLMSPTTTMATINGYNNDALLDFQNQIILDDDVEEKSESAAHYKNLVRKVHRLKRGLLLNAVEEPSARSVNQFRTLMLQLMVQQQLQQMMATTTEEEEVDDNYQKKNRFVGKEEEAAKEHGAHYASTSSSLPAHAKNALTPSAA